MSHLRLLSLLPSATEIIHALGLGRYQVGRSHECDYPPCVTGLPICTRPVIPVSDSSAEIDRLVKERLALALSIYEVDGALLRTLQPTHIVTQAQCKVCAISVDDVRLALASELDARAKIISLEPYTLSDLWSGIRHVAQGCEQTEAGERLVAALQEQMNTIEKRASQAEKRLIRTFAFEGIHRW